jgi:hypothetical protein
VHRRRPLTAPVFGPKGVWMRILREAAWDPKGMRIRS